MNWLQIAQSVIAGVLYFSAWTFLFYCFNVLRNRRLERRLRRLVKPRGVKCEDKQVHLIVANYTAVEVTVRRLELTTDDGERIPLRYTGDIGEVELDYSDLTEFVGHWRAVQGERFNLAGMRDRGFVELPPQTGGYWTLDEEELQQPREIVGCCVVVEYPTMFRSRAILRVNVGEDVVQSLRDAYQKYLEAARARTAAE